MDNTQTLELELKSTVQNAIGKMDELINKLGKVDSATAKTKTTVDKFSKAFASLGTYAGMKKLSKQLMEWMNLSIDFTEQLNLFNVVFGNIEKNGVKTFSTLGKKATQFQSRMNEAFGTNKTETLKYQALFQSMGENVGIPDNYSAVMSETMTKLTYDLASLYNKSESTTGEALRAGVYAGQTKPLRSFGIDVTQTSMQPILNSLGITDRSIKQMSQAEKEILRYLATLKQAEIAMGDMANTIESPSNQLKVFKQQLVEAKVALTSLFIGGFADILPYANAILMVVKEISRAIASFFGIELTDYNSGIASTEDAYLGIGDSIDDATGKAKKLKREILGFDQIHNINEKDSSGSGSSDVSGGIDQRLLDAITGYDNGMDKVRMKATEIRDKIMEWLGFHKKINPLTGEVYFEYQGIDKTLKNVWKSFKGLSTQGKILIGLGLVAGATKLWNIGKKMVTVFGSSGLGKAVKSLIAPTKDFIYWTKLGVQVNGNLVSGVRDGIQAWRASNGIINEATGKVQGLSGVMNGATIAIKGLIIGALGLATVHDSMKSISTEGANLVNVLGLVGGSIGTIASGVQIGAIFGPWGAVIGGATGALLTLIATIQGYQDETDKMIEKDKEKLEATKEYLQGLKDERIALEESLTANLALTQSHTTLVSELNSIVDANGEVKKGYENRAKFILETLSSAYGVEYTLIGNQIKNYDELIKKIQKTIDLKNAEILADANKEQYAKDLQEENRLWAKKTEAVKEHEKYLKQIKEAEEELGQLVIDQNSSINTVILENDLRTAELTEKIEKLSEEEKKWAKTVKDATAEYEGNITRQTLYSNLQESIMTGNMEDIKKSVEEFTNSYYENNEKVNLSLADRVAKEQENANIILGVYKQKYGKDIPEELKNSAQASLNEVVSGLVSQTKEVKDGKVSADLANAWYTLGTLNKTKFMENFQKIPADIQQKIVDKMYDEGYEMTAKLQEGIKQVNPEINIKTKVQKATVKVDADVSQAKKKTDNWLSGIVKSLATVIGVSIRADGGAFYGGNWHSIPQYANGGIPSHGSMFVAGERGAEIVGHINGRTEVLNQSQIASAIYSAVVSAMSQFSGQSSQIDVHVHTDEGTIIDRINQKTKQTGICPINI